MPVNPNRDSLCNELMAERQMLVWLGGFLRTAKASATEEDAEQIESCLDWAERRQYILLHRYGGLLPKQTPEERAERDAQLKEVIGVLAECPDGLGREDVQARLPHIEEARVTGLLFELVDSRGWAIEVWPQSGPRRFRLLTGPGDALGTVARLTTRYAGSLVDVLRGRGWRYWTDRG